MIAGAHIDSQERTERLSRLHLLAVHFYGPSLIKRDRGEEHSRFRRTHGSGKFRIFPARQMHRGLVQPVIDLDHRVL